MGHILDQMLDQMIISLVTTALQSHRVRLCAEVTCSSHIDYPERSAFTNG